MISHLNAHFWPISSPKIHSECLSRPIVLEKDSHTKPDEKKQKRPTQCSLDKSPVPRWFDFECGLGAPVSLESHWNHWWWWMMMNVVDCAFVDDQWTVDQQCWWMLWIFPLWLRFLNAWTQFVQKTEDFADLSFFCQSRIYCAYLAECDCERGSTCWKATRNHAKIWRRSTSFQTSYGSQQTQTMPYDAQLGHWGFHKFRWVECLESPWQRRLPFVPQLHTLEGVRLFAARRTRERWAGDGSIRGHAWTKCWMTHQHLHQNHYT